MLNRKYNLLLLLFFVLINASVMGQNVSKTGTTAAKFLSVGIGARANAMGGAYSTMNDDAFAMYWNPAGTASLTNIEAVFTYSELFADIKVNYFGIVIPVDDVGSFGIYATMLNYGEMEITTELNPEGTGGVFTAGSYAFGITYSRNITSNFSAGAALKYIREDIDGNGANGFAFDIGTIFLTPFYDIKFGSSITNFGTKMQMTGDGLLVRYDQDPTTSGNNESVDAYLATDEFELPLRLQIGLSKEWNFLDDQRFIFALDVTYPNDNHPWVNIGSELALLDNLIALRGGFKTLLLDGSQEGLTLGLGINYNKQRYFGVSFSYAYQSHVNLADLHSIEIKLRL